MKHLVNYINESIFGNNIKSDIVIDGERIDPALWEKCKKSFDWFRKVMIGGKKTFEFEEYGVRNLKHDVIYDEKDCILMTDEDKSRITIICPETIWYNYIKGSLTEIQLGGNKIDETQPRTGLYCRTFAKNSNGHFYSLEYSRGKYSGYTPETISDKAKKIIEKF